MISVGFAGFSLGFSLILAIGAQNSFILRQGLVREHVGWLCLFCALSDAMLISAGIAGFDVLILKIPEFKPAMTILGAGFLILYGLSRFREAYKTHDGLIEEKPRKTRFHVALAHAFALTWLNPHVYLDTVILMGAISTEYSTAHEKIIFAIGAICASFVFFFSLGYGAKFLRPFMVSPKSWRFLDVGVGGVMWVIAVKLLWSL